MPPMSTEIDKRSSLSVSPTIVAVVSPAGGVGKTVTTAMLAINLAQRGLHVVALNFTHSGDLATCLLGKKSHATNDAQKRHSDGRVSGVVEVPLQGSASGRCWLANRTRCLHAASVAPSSDAEDLCEVLGKDLPRGVDLVLIDTSSGVGAATQAALRVAHGALVITHADGRWERIARFREVVAELLPSSGQRLAEDRILINQFDLDVPTMLLAEKRIRAAHTSSLLATTVSTFPEQQEALWVSGVAQSQELFGAHSPAASHYDQLTDEVLATWGWAGVRRPVG